MERIEQNQLERDPLRLLKRQGVKIESRLQAKRQRLTITILGVLHTGQTDDQIEEMIEGCDLVTVELPSLAVRSDYPSRNTFWNEVLLKARKAGKEIRGVNNNFAAVNTLRFMDGRDHRFRGEGRDTPRDSNLASALEFYADETGNIFGPYSREYPDIFGLSLMALKHLLRLRVDRTQMQQVIRNLLPIIDQGEGDSGVLHIGGAGHNPNLVAIAHKVFTPGELVDVVQSADSRVTDFMPDDITFFSQFVPIGEGLLCTEIHEDRVFIRRQKATDVLGKAVSGARKYLTHFYARQSIVGEFESIAPNNNYSQLEKFVVNFLLSLVDPRDLASLPNVTLNFPRDLADFIDSRYPVKARHVASARKVLERGKIFFGS